MPHQWRPIPADGRAIYLVDDFGGREFIYEHADFAVVSPIPLQARLSPPQLPAMRSKAEEGTLFIQNAYLTRNDPEGRIQAGDIAAIRVNELGVQPRAERRVCTPYVNVEIPKRVLGTVPVEADGSAFFKVPSGVPLQLQALDADGRAILTEKSFFYVQSGETRSCIGCHEPSEQTPDMRAFSRLRDQRPLALERSATYSEEEGMSFLRCVQPVLDQYCISCHGLAERLAGGVDLTSAASEKSRKYPVSYLALTQRGNFYLGRKSEMYNELPNISRAFEPYYARGCRVSEMILSGHGEVKLDYGSQQAIFEWMDLNAPMLGDISPESDRKEYRRFRGKGVAALRAEIAKQFGEQFAADPIEALVNRAYPEKSRILLAPLSAQAGGWGQVDGWKTRDSKAFKRMEACVMKSIRVSDDEYDRGWLGSRVEPWVLKQRELFKAARSKVE